MFMLFGPHVQDGRHAHKWENNIYRLLNTFHLTCVHIILVRFGLLSGHLLENSCSLV